jgi:hypothetical protein
MIIMEVMVSYHKRDKNNLIVDKTTKLKKDHKIILSHFVNTTANLKLLYSIRSFWLIVNIL